MDQAALIALVDQLRAQGREASTVEFKSNWDLPRVASRVIRIF